MKRNVQTGQIVILNQPRVLYSLWENLLFFQEMPFNVHIPNHTLECYSNENLRYLHNTENCCVLWANITYLEIRPLAGKPETTVDGKTNTPAGLWSEGNITRDFSMGTWKAGPATYGAEARGSQEEIPMRGLSAICPFFIACVFLLLP